MESKYKERAKKILSIRDKYQDIVTMEVYEDIVDAMCELAEEVENKSKIFTEVYDSLSEIDSKKLYTKKQVDELITLEKQKYLTELANQFKETMSNDLQQNLAKERYEKALKFWNDPTADNNHNIIKVLKIAAGLKSEV